MTGEACLDPSSNYYLLVTLGADNCVHYGIHLLGSEYQRHSLAERPGTVPGEGHTEVQWRYILVTTRGVEIDIGVVNFK